MQHGAAAVMTIVGLVAAGFAPVHPVSETPAGLAGAHTAPARPTDARHSELRRRIDAQPRTHWSPAAADPAYAAYASRAAQPLPTLGPLDAQKRVTYFIAEGTDGSRYRTSDRELAIWALQDWERAANGRLRFEPSPEREALVQVHWVPASAGQYGEMRSMFVNGRRGAAVYVRPDTDALGPDIARVARQDALLRDTIVYLTCLHELGHALGLGHTAEYRDIMYFFGFGGDIPGFFTRYRTQLRTRDDIPRVSGLSPADVETLRQLYD